MVDVMLIVLAVLVLAVTAGLVAGLLLALSALERIEAKLQRPSGLSFPPIKLDRGDTYWFPAGSMDGAEVKEVV
jgi:biopolymer transport protein ExbD